MVTVDLACVFHSGTIIIGRHLPCMQYQAYLYIKQGSVDSESEKDVEQRNQANEEGFEIEEGWPEVFWLKVSNNLDKYIIS